MIFYLLGLLSYYKLANKPVPASICLLFFAVITVPPVATLFFFINKHWTFQLIAFAGGLFCWTFIEYFIHRFMMHGKEKKNIIRVCIFIIMLRAIFTSRQRVLYFGCTPYRLQYFLQQLFIHIAGITGFFPLYSLCTLLHTPWASKWIGGLQKFHMQHHFGQTENALA
jgi:hypothetical protein